MAVDVEDAACRPELREAWFAIGLIRQGVERELFDLHRAEGEAALADRVTR